ncbi:Uncharacterized protein PECH_002037 [Penicillium ucsense]|uniref:UspA domain-containing protein n=1 Tax=Penicillium ucsense TaxID=2839758 RepID=A0A8J8W505_9EURO|nr:Uncharacterized protein PECM_002600 [Penicillium ucsense]KAF7738001.1 Uncharacterized protein PECH_002037 [Penicillium ucsense]
MSTGAEGHGSSTSSTPPAVTTSSRRKTRRSKAPSPPRGSRKSTRPKKSRVLHCAVRRIRKRPVPQTPDRERLLEVARRKAQGITVPLVPSSLCGAPMIMSRSASPDRQAATGEHGQRAGGEGSSSGQRRARTIGDVGVEEDARSDVSALSSESTMSKRKGRKAMAAMMSGLEGRLFPRSLSRGRESSRGPSTRKRTSSLDSHSAHSAARLSRSASPTHRPSPVSSHVMTLAASGKEPPLNMEPTRNKSDETLVMHSGDMPGYVQPAEHSESGERVAKDVFDRENNMVASSSDDDHGEQGNSDDGDDDHDDDSESDSDDGDDEGSKEDEPCAPGVTFVNVARGRQTNPRVDNTSSNNPGDNGSSKEPPSTHQDSHPTTSPKLNIPNQNRKPQKSVLKSVVRPQTNYEIPTPRARSAAGTPCGSDDEEEEAAINRAQQMSIYVSTIDNRVPNRSIRTIVRGEYDDVQQEANEGRRRQRKYLVATDLSQESQYALEWTIGGLLRSGDTMYAIYAIHEDANATSVQIGEGGKAMQDAVAVVGNQTKEATGAPRAPGPLNLLGRLSSGVASKAGSVESRISPAAEAERVRAVEKISDICIGFLRKTGLTVRIAVEVIHCKSPKQMITEAIDELEPTLAIVGARGQSALKGVLLGSFSNYLISKSSVPVMVARHKLQRQLSTHQTGMRLANNLTASKTLRVRLETEAKAEAKAKLQAKAQAKKDKAH